MDTLSEIIVLRPSELESIVTRAVEAALARVVQAGEPSSSSHNVIHGRDNVKKFLNVSDRTLRDRVRRFPTAFFIDGRKTFILNVLKLYELQRNEERMIHPSKRRTTKRQQGI